MSTPLEKFQMVIGGKSVDAISGKTFESENPYTGRPWAVIPDAGPEDVDAAVEVRADPTLLPTAIEEVLRYRTPFPRLARRATTEVEVGGAVIPPDGVVIPWLTAVNRDERVFAEPNRFDIHRRPNPHLTFGHGIHFCLGAPLARLEAKIALTILLERYREIAVASDAPVEHRNPWVMVSVTKLPLEVRSA